MWNIFDAFPLWKQCIRFNKRNIKNKDFKYIVLIHSTKRFNLRDDLEIIFKRNYMSCSLLLTQKQAIVMYCTLFTDKEFETYGPIAKNISDKICLKVYNEFTSNLDVKFVALRYAKIPYKSLILEEWCH